MPAQRTNKTSNGEERAEQGIAGVCWRWHRGAGGPCMHGCIVARRPNHLGDKEVMVLRVHGPAAGQ